MTFKITNENCEHDLLTFNERRNTKCSIYYLRDNIVFFGKTKILEHGYSSKDFNYHNEIFDFISNKYYPKLNKEWTENICKAQYLKNYENIINLHYKLSKYTIAKEIAIYKMMNA